ERVPLSAPLLTGERDITLPLADVELPGDGRHTLEPLGGGVGLLSAAGLPLLPLPTVPDGGARQRLGGGDVTGRRAGSPGAEAEALDRLAPEQVLLDDRVDLLGGAHGVPDPRGVDHHRRPELALVETARLVDAHTAGHAPRLHRLLEVIAESLRALLGSAPAAIGGVAPVHADEDVNVVGLHTLAILPRPPTARSSPPRSCGRLRAGGPGEAGPAATRDARAPGLFGRRSRHRATIGPACNGASASGAGRSSRSSTLHARWRRWWRRRAS